MEETTKTQYTYWIKRLRTFAGVKKSQAISTDTLLQFFLSLADKKSNGVRVAWNALNRHFQAILATMPDEFQAQFEATMHTCYPRRVARSLPLCETQIVAPDVIEAWLHTVTGEHYQCAAWLCYNPGLSLQDVLRLTVSDARWLPIPPHLKAWFRGHCAGLRTQRQRWLFPGRHGEPVSASAIHKALSRAKRDGALPSGSGIRLIRLVGIVRLLREEGRDPNEVMARAGIATRRAFLPYLNAAMR